MAPRHPECQGEQYGREEGELDEDEEDVYDTNVTDVVEGTPLGLGEGQQIKLDKSLWLVMAKDIQHLEPISPCLTNVKGTPAVDFVIR